MCAVYVEIPERCMADFASRVSHIAGGFRERSPDFSWQQLGLGVKLLREAWWI